ncbi:hypothetical protein BGW38_000637 [Lunasporangiospora selenospora]|uniref:Uncharacterized protein n=1 Tax=Lunasporangiospora selenospora TaxID=979761 RepID=A0A9P6G3Z5_9FUNG|nr:hypothetical protein BGW38_000637 [Lunasporangiospora selenospora]
MATEDSQKKIRGLVDLALTYVVEPQPVSVPAVPDTMDELVAQVQSGLKIESDNSDKDEPWDSENFSQRLAGLGQIISNDVTKTVIACKPPADPVAAIGMVDALGESCFRLAGFVDAIPVKTAGQTYKLEIQTIANEIFLGVAVLMNEFLDEPVEKVAQLQQQKNFTLDTTPAATTKAPKEAAGIDKQYLVKTGIVWEACTALEKASRSNSQAVAKKWDGLVAMLDDAISEVQEMIDSNDDKDGAANDNDDDESGNESDDSWNDDEKLTEKEKQLCIKSNAMLKLTRLLLKKLKQRCLDTAPALSLSASTPSPTTEAESVTFRPSDLARMWDQLHIRAKEVTALSDEIATSLYGPQDQEAVSGLLKDLNCKDHECILLGRVFVRGQVEHEKWMDMCEAQFKKILEKPLSA